ncbi:MAG: hypothetical protein WCP03_00330 [Candidatus Saccharibacteria bacterium]
MFNHNKSKPQSDEDQIDPEITKIMGPPPEEAAPQLSDDAPKPELDEQQRVNQLLNTNINEGEVGDTSTAGNGMSSDQSLSEETDYNGQKIISESNTSSDDTKTDQIVKDIIATEGDDLIDAKDEKIANLSVKTSRPKGIKGLILAWWGHKKLRNFTFIVVFASLLALALVPTTRYAILNTAGVKASVSLMVIDAKSGRPIKNVEVTVADVTATTNNDGYVSLINIKLGPTQLEFAKRSFAPLSQNIVIGWGSNPFADPFQMKPVGSKYSFVITDWLSKKPIIKAEVTDGDSIGIADDSGIAILTFEPKDDNVKLKIKADGYREESLQIESSDKTTKEVKLVPQKPDVFVSRRSGKYDLYKRDVDGKNEVVLLAGTGNEQEDISLLVHPETPTAAFVSSRDGKRNKDGYLLSNLYMVDISNKTVSKVETTESERIQLIDWIGDKLIFVKIVAGPSGNNNGRQRLISYDLKQDKQTELASSNYFNDVEVINKLVYYAPSSGGVASANSQLFKINPDGSSKASLVNKEVWVLYRSSYEKMQVSALNNTWYDLSISDNKVTALPGSPATPNHRIYVNSPGDSNSLYVDIRDGKGVLSIQDLKNNTEKVLYSKGGLGYPIRWLNDKNILFRISNSQETADYVLNIDAPNPIKVTDATNTSSTSRWYYYR